MTKQQIQNVIENSGNRAVECQGAEQASAAWMQVKMLGEIALQLAVMNEREMGKAGVHHRSTLVDSERNILSQTKPGTRIADLPRNGAAKCDDVGAPTNF